MFLASSRLLAAIGWAAIGWAAMGVGLAACSALPLGGGPYPEACADLGFSDRRCAAIVERARKSAQIASDEVASIDLLPPYVPDTTVRVRFHLVDGDAVTKVVRCGSSPINGGLSPISGDSLACDREPRISLFSGVDMDVPCSGEPPAGCATLPPPPAPGLVAQARPLRVAAIDVPLDHLGPYEIEVGDAGLPGGYLTTRSLTLAEYQPSSFWVEGGVRLEVRPEDPARPPIYSRYREPFDGVEPVRVFLVFEVTELTPGAVLRVRDIVVE
jgi:hypothetical protein